MQSTQSFFKFGSALAGLGLAGGCAALFGFALIGTQGALHEGAPVSEPVRFDQLSYFDHAPGQSPAASSIRRLGMSAVLEDAAADETAISALSDKAGDTVDDDRSQTRHAALDPAQDPHLQPDPNRLLQPETVSVGDRITVVTPDGLSYVYRVTAREAAAGTDDATLDKTKLGQAAPLDADCKALNGVVAGAFRLVIESVKNDKAHGTPSEQKL
ncbi:hypothetical protein A7A08_02198 [Methyloligella halotolerans]|uniref:Uncharacterized protein n=1 Tax=Methyloligella halotolerans TaxID=1177755 RepID=A0A1E2RXF1_9HYPH|nr:hypothetical protein [Methyloligella halotolerans]ODA66901.1 hypothetical protein A7A08_02198 [Methyloligella halotolerans]